MLKALAGVFFGMCIGVIGVWPANAGIVLFDKGHGERFLLDRSGPLDLSTLDSIMRKHGLEVKDVDAPLSSDRLAADGIIMSGPFAPATSAEIDDLVHFIERGGRLAIMLHIGKPMRELIQRLGVDVSTGVIHEQHGIIGDDPVNFRVSGLQPHPLFKGIKQFSLYGGWALMNFVPTASIIAATSKDAWIDLDGDRKLSAADAVQSFGVVVVGRLGQGQFLVFGDDAIFQNKFLDDDNRRLAHNLADWFGETGR